MKIRWPMYAEPEEAGGSTQTEGSEGKEEPSGAKYLPQLAPELREKYGDRLAEHPSLNDLVTHAMTTEDRLSRSVVMPDAENPDPEDVKAFREALGLPESAEGYEIDASASKDIEGFDVEAIKKLAYSMSLGGKQAQKFHDAIAGSISAGREQQTKAMQEAQEQFDAKLTEVLGGDEKKAEGARNLLKAAMVRLGKDAGSDVVQKIAESGLLYDPQFAVAMARNEDRLSETPFFQDGGARSEGEKQGKKLGEFGSNYSTEFQQAFGR